MRKKGLGETKPAGDLIEFTAEDASPLASGVNYSSWFAPNEQAVDESETEASGVANAEASPVFKLLSEPTLTPLKRENRARLQMQSPNRLYFYWSLKDNPFKNVNRALGTQASNYTLVLKLVDVESEQEMVRPVDSEGNWWFDVEDDRAYRAEVGLYAVNRPYVRILFSNVVRTPRKGPSPQPAAESEWRVSAHKFSQVLEVAGFARDAFDVALEGDDHIESGATARTAFADYLGGPDGSDALAGFKPSDLRLVLLTYAAGGSLASLQGRIGPELFAFLERSKAGVDRERASAALGRRYDVETDEFEEDPSSDSAVFGASAVHFPRRVRTRRRITEYSPLSSFSVAGS